MIKRVVFSALMLVIAGPLAAQDDADSWADGFYLGAGASFLRIDTDLASHGLEPAEPIESADFKKTSIAAKLFAGYRITRYFGIEVGYFEADDVEQNYCFLDDTGGCAEDRFNPPQPPPPLPPNITSLVTSSAWTVELPTSGYTVAVTGFWPLNDTFELMLKVGGINADVDGNGFEKIVGGLIPVQPPVVEEPNPPVYETITSSNWDGMGSFGINFNSESGISVRAEIEYFAIKEIDEPWLASLNAVYNF